MLMKGLAEAHYDSLNVAWAEPTGQIYRSLYSKGCFQCKILHVGKVKQSHDRNGARELVQKLC